MEGPYTLIWKHLSSWKTGTKGLEHQRIVSHTDLKILKGHFAILVVVHLLHGHLDQVLDPLVRLLLHTGAEQRSLQQVQHLLPEDPYIQRSQASKMSLSRILADEPIMVEVIDGEGVGGLLVSGSLQQDVQAHDPLLPGDRAIALRVEELEDPVHQDVVGHVEGVVEKLAERVSVHCVQLDGIVPRIYPYTCRRPVRSIGAKMSNHLLD